MKVEFGAWIPWKEWRGFGLLLIGGLGVAFLYQIVQLVRSLWILEPGPERAAIWAMLFMIVAVFSAILGIGGGLLRALGRQRRAESERDPSAPGPSSDRRT